ncbi:cell envelope integrity protein TolA [Histophilus somni]|uniref:cell envelope integrity protein TolA n=1 Tax=Histophilus somni TaxID=731 RepID=UPI0000397749|nr:cell envelope integrity protein TolA [Histophilus somni]ACA31076.1 Tol-Pal system TolA [Histophilus somni 2336]QQF85869.1 cell envelope integrity protein TolA [Histophilus somni]QQJ90320.1 cell envelope integrity protein TolA [Histophilus somni]
MCNHRQKNELGAILLSIFLHILLLSLLVLGSNYNNVEIMGGGEGDGEVMSAVMVDTGTIAKEWGRLQEKKKSNPDKQETFVEATQEDELMENVDVFEEKIREDEDVQKRLAEQKIKEEKIQQERLAKQLEEDNAKKETVAKLKAEAEEMRLQALAKKIEEEKKVRDAEEKQKVEKLAKERAEKLAKEKADRLAKQKALKEAKIKAEKAAKAKAELAQRKAEQAALDDFFNGGDIAGSSKNGGNMTMKGSQGVGAGFENGKGGRTGEQYAAQIKREIQRRFLKEPRFANKVCVIEVELARDGTITNFRKLSGSDDICTAGLSAVSRTKKVPEAPTDEIYRKYKKFPLEFRLK